MPKPKASTGEKNLISQRLIELRRQHNMSQRLLAYQLQLNGYDMDKNVSFFALFSIEFYMGLEIQSVVKMIQK